MKTRSKTLGRSSFTDAKLLDRILGAHGLTDAQLQEVSTLAAGIANGTVQALARGTRDRMVRLARELGAMWEDQPVRSYDQHRTVKEQARAKSPGEAVAAVVLSDEARNRALHQMLAARKRSA